MSIKYGSLTFSHSINVGDEIQCLAVEQHLPRVDALFDRDYLAEAQADEPHVVVMQGWFSHKPKTVLPTAKNIRPVFVGFHITDSNDTKEVFQSPEVVEFLKDHQPIGCRDHGTVRYLESLGVEAYYTSCLTTTFPTRKAPPKEGKIFVIDASWIPIPQHLHEQAVYSTHAVYELPAQTQTTEGKRKHAREILEMYRDQARLVITTRLHCALPCIAMGIPVVFFNNPNDYRVKIFEELGGTINPPGPWWVMRWYRSRPLAFLRRVFRFFYPRVFFRNVNWNPPVLDLEDHKKKLTSILNDKLDQAVNKESN